MNQQFHIANGKVSKCTATKRKCPYSYLKHFDTEEEAILYNDCENEATQEYNRIHKLNSQQILKERGLTGAANKNKIYEWKSIQKHIEDTKSNIEPKLYTYKAGYPEKKAEEIEIVLEKALGNKKKPFHYIVDDGINYYIWTNSSEERDVVILSKKYAFPVYIVDKDKKDDFCKWNPEHRRVIEVKNITKAAQLSAVTCRVNQNCKGLTVHGFNLSETPRSLQYALSKWDPRKDSYKSLDLKIPQEEARQYLIDDYRRLGASNLELFDTNRQTILSYDLVNMSDKDILEHMRINKVEVTLNMRANESANNITQNDKERFLNNYQCMFKDGKTKEKFTVADLDCYSSPTEEAVYIERNWKKTARGWNPPFIRMGDFVKKFDNIEQGGYIKNDTELSLDDFQVYTPKLTGNIKNKCTDEDIHAVYFDSRRKVQTRVDFIND